MLRYTGMIRGVLSVVVLLALAASVQGGERWMNEPGLPGDPGQWKTGGIQTIVIDPGHGGWDHGTVSAGGVKEKDLVLSISKMLAKRISKIFKAKVILTRKDDTYIPLTKRTSIAEEAMADIFVSIHANSSPKRHIKGLEVYYLSEAPSDEEAGMTAEAENRAGGAEEGGNLSDLQKTLGDLVQTGHVEESRLFAEKVTSGLEFIGKEKIRRIKHANFWVLLMASMPAILIEVGYLSNKDEARVLRLRGTQEDICDGLVRGIKDFEDAWIRSAGRPRKSETWATH